MAENSPPKPPKPIRARRWSRRRIAAGAAAALSHGDAPHRHPGRRPSPAVLLYRGLRDRFVLPECDSERAKQTLAEVLKQLQLEPTRYEPIKTVSTSKDQVVCNAVLPLPDGGNVVADYTFYWQGSTADMRYSISRKRP